MLENNIEVVEIESRLNDLEANGKTVLIMAQDKKIVGILALADTVKETSAGAISKFSRMGIDVYMVTGDNRVQLML